MDHSRFLSRDLNNNNNNNDDDDDDDDHDSGGDIPQQQQQQQQRNLLQLIDQEEWINLHGITAEPRYGNQSESNQQLERERIQQEREYQSTVHQTIFGVQDDDDEQQQERIKNFQQWEHRGDMVELKVQRSNHSTNDENENFNSDENPNPTDTFVLRVNLVTLARHSDVVYTLAVNRQWFPNTCHPKQQQDDDGSLPTSTTLQISLLEFSIDTVLLFLDLLSDTSDTTTNNNDNNDKFLYNIDRHLPSDRVVDCCRLASFLQCITLLHQIVHEILVPAVDSRNCMSLYQLADQLSLPKLLEASVNHMIQSLDSTLQQSQQQQQQPSNNTTISDNENHDTQHDVNDGNVPWNEYLTPDLQAQIVTIQAILRSTNRKQMFFSTVTEYLALLSEQYQYYQERLDEAIEQQEQHPPGTVGWKYSQTKIELQQVKVERLRRFVDEQRRLLGASTTNHHNDNDIRDKTDPAECNNQRGHNSKHNQDTVQDNCDRVSSSSTRRGSNKRQCSGSSFITVQVVSCICILLGLCRTVTSSTPWIVTRSNPFGVRPHTHLQRQQHLWSSQVLSLRGGDALEEYDDDDEYDAEEEEEPIEAEGRSKPSPPPQRRNPKGTYDHSMIDLPPDPTHGGRPVPSRRRRRQPPPTPLRKKKKKPHWSQRLATSSLQMTGQLAWNTLIKQPTKLAYHVIRPKYVDIRETDGLWRLEQQVTEREGREVASVATIELQAKPRIVILRKEEQSPTTNKNTKNSPNQPKVLIIKEPYTFTKKKLTGSFQTQFVIPAFLIGENQMRLYGYRGTWQRKLADRRVIKLVGKIYQVHKQRFGKNRGEYVFGQAVGTFVARRRIKAKMIDDDDEEEEEELEDMDEYDGDEEEEKEDVEEEWEEIDEDWEDEEE